MLAHIKITFSALTNWIGHIEMINIHTEIR